MNVFVDNFSVTYKLLLYRLVVSIVAFSICYAGIYPFIKGLINSAEFTELVGGIKDFATNFFKGEVASLQGFSEQVKEAFTSFLALLNTKTTQFALSGLLLLLVYIVERWFMGLANFATATVVNERMALRAQSAFMRTLISNFKTASLYNLIYVPLSIVYDLIVCVAMFFLLYFFVMHAELPILVAVFLFVLVLIVAIVFKMVFTTDWMPALIRGKMTQKQAFKYTFSRKGKSTSNIFSNFVVLVLIIFAANVAALFLTFGVGMLLTIPASYVVLVCFELVNYFDREQIKYFIDDHNIVKPAKEHSPTREEFFRGDGD